MEILKFTKCDRWISSLSLNTTGIWELIIWELIICETISAFLQSSIYEKVIICIRLKYATMNFPFILTPFVLSLLYLWSFLFPFFLINEHLLSSV